MSVVDHRFADLAEVLAGRDVLVTTYGTYDGGRLLRPGHPQTGALTDLAARWGRSGIADLAIAYVLGHDFVTSIALGALTAEQAAENLDLATRPPLTAEQQTQLRAELALQA